VNPDRRHVLVRASALRSKLLALFPLLLTAAPAGAAPDLSKLPASVQEYVAGWLARDGERVDRVVNEDGGYRDPALWYPVSGPDLADYVETFEPAKLELLSAERPAPDKVDLGWRLVWPDARGEQRFTDHLTMDGGEIKMVLSDGPPIPARHWPVIEAYFRHREAAQAAETAALFGEDGVLEAKTLPRGGISGARLRQYFDGDANHKLVMRPGGVRQLTKDGRPAVDFTLLRRGDGSQLAGGRELFTLEGNRIKRLQGLF
jgi:hypothetical protein